MTDDKFLLANTVFILIGIILLVASVFWGQSTDPSVALKSGVDTYCNTLSKAHRMYIRDYVNNGSPHKIIITCQGD